MTQKILPKNPPRLQKQGPSTRHKRGGLEGVPDSLRLPVSPFISSLRGSRRNDSDHSNSSNNNSSTQVQCVCFDLEPHQHFIELREELPDCIVEALWYDETEVQDMIASATAVLEGDNKEDSPRGLEHYSFEGAQRRRQERSKASEAVLGEQLRQQAAAAFDEKVKNADELIAQEYRKVSQKMQEMAYRRGKNDAAEVSGGLLARALNLSLFKVQ